MMYVYIMTTSDVVLEARPWPRGTSRPNFCDLGFDLRTYGLGLGLGLGLKGPGLGLKVP